MGTSPAHRLGFFAVLTFDVVAELVDGGMRRQGRRRRRVVGLFGKIHGVESEGNQFFFFAPRKWRYFWEVEGGR